MPLQRKIITNNNLGQLTASTQKISNQIFGRDLTITELRLLPVIDQAVKNQGIIDLTKLSAEELEALDNWHQLFFLTIFDDGHKVAVTETFFWFMQGALLSSYVKYISD